MNFNSTRLTKLSFHRIVKHLIVTNDQELLIFNNAVIVTVVKYCIDKNKQHCISKTDIFNKELFCAICSLKARFKRRATAVPN